VLLEEKVALITGGAGGIGAATAARFAAEGAVVVVADRDEVGGERVVEAIRAAGGTAELVPTDLTRLEDIDAMVEQTVARHGRLDILHNNAVVARMGRVGDLSVRDWELTMQVGLTAYWYATKVALGPMLERRSGAIVNTSSVSGLAGDWGLAAYNASKAAVVNLTRVTAIEYGAAGIRCNAVCPGPIGTPNLLGEAERSAEVYDAVRQAIPMGRFGTPEEIAAVVLFLASDRAPYGNGAAYVADGGLFAHTNLPSFGDGDW
jgi:meso-butanediol dehydrogenase/(S,S)-butanediol dehydrogenase/diacetyl reductase